jgi:acyl-CoA synthetase (AMP-forming)/AMP-acid ligase II
VTAAPDLAAIIYTSGSTGAPRGVMLSHGNIAANTASIVEYLELSSADRVMVILPFYYVYGLSLLHTHVAVAGSLVIDNRFAFPNAVLKAMREHAVTGFAGVPSTFALLLHRSNVGAMSFPSLRYVTQAGGPMPPALVQEWLRTVPGVPFFVMYGATEASARLAYLPPAELPRRLGSIGRAIPGVELRVVREDGDVASPGEIGEIVARGGNISAGYWNCADETRQRFGPDGFRTGDLGFADAEGFLYLVGRRHDMIKVGAHRVSAKEIEEALHEHAAVHEAAIVGAPDPLLGEVPVAHLVLREGRLATAADIVAFCRERLPEHKVPARVEFHTDLPKNGAGKLVKAALREAADPERVA